MSPPMGKIVAFPLLLLLAAGPAFAGFPIAEPPVPQRVALADAIVVGRVVEVEEEPIDAYPLLRIRGGLKVSFQIARVRIDSTLRGAVGEQVRVGVGPGRAMPKLKAGQTGCFFLHKHPEQSFCVLSGGS